MVNKVKWGTCSDYHLHEMKYYMLCEDLSSNKFKLQVFHSFLQ